MKRLVIAAIVGAAMGLGAGCGQSICARGESVGKALEEKAKPCSSTDGGVSVTTSKTDVAKCEANLKSCTSTDQENVNKAYDCMDKIGTCAKGSELTWIGQLLDCTKTTSISPACSSAVFGGSTDGGQ